MSYQNTLIIGNVGREVVSRVTNSGKEVANFSVAVNEKMGDDEQTTWFQVTAWEKLAEIATAHISKGQLVLVEGRIAVETWHDQNGATQAALRLTARNIRFLGGKPDTDATEAT